MEKDRKNNYGARFGERPGAAAVRIRVRGTKETPRDGTFHCSEQVAGIVARVRAKQAETVTVSPKRKRKKGKA